MGCGRVGSTLADILEDRGNSVAVIDRDPEAFRKLRASFKGSRVTGVGFDRDVLIQAGIQEADAFAAVSSGDNLNIISAPGVRGSARGHPPRAARPEPPQAAPRGRGAALAGPDRQDRAGRGGVLRAVA